MWIVDGVAMRMARIAWKIYRDRLIDDHCDTVAIIDSTIDVLHRIRKIMHYLR